MQFTARGKTHISDSFAIIDGVIELLGFWNSMQMNSMWLLTMTVKIVSNRFQHWDWIGTLAEFPPRNDHKYSLNDYRKCLGFFGLKNEICWAFPIDFINSLQLNKCCSNKPVNRRVCCIDTIDVRVCVDVLMCLLRFVYSKSKLQVLRKERASENQHMTISPHGESTDVSYAHTH